MAAISLIVALVSAVLAVAEASNFSEHFQSLKSKSVRQNIVNHLKNEMAESNKLLFFWDKECVAALPEKLMDHPVNFEDDWSDEDETEYEVRAAGEANKNSAKAYMSRGVFFVDRLSTKLAADETAAKIAKGRKVAMYWVAKVLGLTLSNTGVFDKVTLQKLMDSQASITATHFPKLSIDVVDFPSLSEKSKTWGVTNGSQMKSYITSSAVSQGLVRAVEAMNCVETILDDERRVAQSEKIQNVYKSQWHLQDQPHSYDISAQAAWNELKSSSANSTGKDIVVAVVDSGCAKHQDMWQNEDNTRYWRNMGETDCFNGIDDDGNGYVDDCWGWDFAEDDNDPFNDVSGHGTSVAAVAGSSHHGNTGSTGVYWKGKIMCLKASDGESYWVSDTVEALEYLLMMGVKISNNSYGGLGGDATELLALKRARDNGHLFITAAGNAACDVDNDESCFFAPGAYKLDNIINVGASDKKGRKATFSCWGKKSVGMFAPGVAIMTATPFHKDGQSECSDCYGTIEGTSFASPIVAGAAATLWGYFEETQPLGWVQSSDAPYLKVKKALMSTTKSTPFVNGLSQVDGTLNLYDALHYYDFGVPGTF